jgi:hypothetical protein
VLFTTFLFFYRTSIKNKKCFHVQPTNIHSLLLVPTIIKKTKKNLIILRARRTVTAWKVEEIKETYFLIAGALSVRLVLLFANAVPRCSFGGFVLHLRIPADGSGP